MDGWIDYQRKKRRKTRAGPWCGIEWRRTIRRANLAPSSLPEEDWKVVHERKPQEWYKLFVLGACLDPSTTYLQHKHGPFWCVSTFFGLVGNKHKIFSIEQVTVFSTPSRASCSSESRFVCDGQCHAWSVNYSFHAIARRWLTTTSQVIDWNPTMTRRKR